MNGGPCCLCGKYGPLTFEHIPPRRCFNNGIVEVMDIAVYGVRNKYNPDAPPRQYRTGFKVPSLCVDCNGKTAKWYGDAFASWTTQAMRFLERIPTDVADGLYLPFNIEPLKVAKQVAVMMAAVARGLIHQSLRMFVLNPRQRGFPAEYSIFCYFVPLPAAGGPTNATVTANAFKMKLGCGIQVHIVAEVSIPPLGYCMVAHEGNWQREVSQQNLCDITWFANCGWGVQRDLFIKIPVRGLLGPLPFAPNSTP